MHPLRFLFEYKMGIERWTIFLGIE